MRAVKSRAVANSVGERLVLVDTSSWIHFLRADGDTHTRARVSAALEAGTARWCAMVRLELWNGARGEHEKKVLREFERLVPELPTVAPVWDAAFELSRRCRTAGITVPATDVLIFACAEHYGAALEHADEDFVRVNGVKSA
jgi:predicted nucleic acid-binding protein